MAGLPTRSDGTGFPVSRFRVPPLARFDVAQSHGYLAKLNEIEAGNFTLQRLVACRASTITRTRLPQSLPIGNRERAIRLCVSITLGLGSM